MVFPKVCSSRTVLLKILGARKSPGELVNMQILLSSSGMTPKVPHSNELLVCGPHGG